MVHEEETYDVVLSFTLFNSATCVYPGTSFLVTKANLAWAEINI